MLPAVAGERAIAVPGTRQRTEDLRAVAALPVQRSAAGTASQPASAQQPAGMARPTIVDLFGGHSRSGALALGTPAPPAPPPVPSQGGAPLPEDVRVQMEQALGGDFGDVRVHVGPEAHAIGARAFAAGSQLCFAPGEYDPSTRSGLQVLAHELVHVNQQRAGRVATPAGAAGINDDAALESEAERAAHTVHEDTPRSVAMSPAPSARTPPPAIQRMILTIGADQHPELADGAENLRGYLGSNETIAGIDAADLHELSNRPLYIVAHGTTEEVGDLTPEQLAIALWSRGLPRSIGEITILSCDSGVAHPTVKRSPAQRLRECLIVLFRIYPEGPPPLAEEEQRDLAKLLRDEVLGTTFPPALFYGWVRTTGLTGKSTDIGGDYRVCGEISDMLFRHVRKLHGLVESLDGEQPDSASIINEVLTLRGELENVVARCQRAQMDEDEAADASADEETDSDEEEEEEEEEEGYEKTPRIEPGRAEHGAADPPGRELEARLAAAGHGTDQLIPSDIDVTEESYDFQDGMSIEDGMLALIEMLDATRDRLSKPPPASVRKALQSALVWYDTAHVTLKRQLVKSRTDSYVSFGGPP